MHLLEIIVLAWLAIEVLIQLYMIVYTRFERLMDQRRANRLTEKEVKETQTTQKKKICIYAVYHYFEHISYGLMRYNLLRVGKIPSFTIRRFLYKWVYCMDITKNTNIYGGCEIRSPWNIHADRCVIAVGCILDGRSGITIGQDVVFGSNVHVWTQEHAVNDPYFRVLAENSKPVVIENHAWICSDSTLLPGTRIGEGAVVASRACVTKDCEPYCIYGSVPAKRIGERNKDLQYKLDKRPTWFFY